MHKTPINVFKTSTWPLACIFSWKNIFNGQKRLSHSQFNKVLPLFRSTFQNIRLVCKNPYLFAQNSKNYKLPIKMKIFMSTSFLESFMIFGSIFTDQKVHERSLPSPPPSSNYQKLRLDCKIHNFLYRAPKITIYLSS